MHSKVPVGGEVSQDFNVAIWTKHRVAEEMDNKQVIEKLQKRFDSVVPMIKVDFLFLNK